MNDHTQDSIPSADSSVKRTAWELLGGAAIISALVSAIISACVGMFMESRLENSKNRVALVIHEKQEFDNAQTKVLTELGMFTAGVLDGSAVNKKQNLIAAIISAQLQSSNLFSQVIPKDRDVVRNYSDGLERLRKRVVAVNSTNDLGPVFVEAQDLLKIRDQISDSVNRDLTVSIF